MLFFTSNESKFSELPQNEDCENVLEPISNDSLSIKYKSKLSSKLSTPLLFLSSSLFSLLVGLLIGTSYPSITSNKLGIQETTKYSPILEDIDIKYDWVQFNGSFMHETIFRQKASPEVDAAWESLGPDYRAIIVPQSLGFKSGLSESHVQVNPKHGGGFPANVEGLHHLHCLNLVRQSLYYNYEYYQDLGHGAFVNDEPILRYHVSHCLDTLRQKLMCTPSIDVLGQVWYDTGSLSVFPDFNTRHKCVNFESIREWAKNHQAPANVPEDYLSPPDPGAVFNEVP